jgi:hypothetical protein
MLRLHTFQLLLRLLKVSPGSPTKPPEHGQLRASVPIKWVAIVAGFFCLSDILVNYGYLVCCIRYFLTRQLWWITGKT